MKYVPLVPFSKQDWAHLHDCWFHVKGTKPTQEQLEELFDRLPADYQHLADGWGMNDTVFRDNVIEWLESNDND
jgi:hypothetical protein